jgi:antitoxin VapB
VSLNITRKETYRMARELADLTGESVTDAVTRAVEERLEKVREQQSESLADRLLAIGKEVAAHLDEPSRTCDHGELLYDGRGLPKASLPTSIVP